MFSSNKSQELTKLIHLMLEDTSRQILASLFYTG